MFGSTMVLISLLAFGGQAELLVQGPDNVEVSAGGEAILTCQLEIPYKFCSFVDPTGTTFPMDPQTVYEDGRISFAGSNDDEKSCGVKLSHVTEADEGTWECIFTVVGEGEAQYIKSQAYVTVLEPSLQIELDEEELSNGKLDGENTGNVTKGDNATSSEMKNVDDSITPGNEFDYSNTQIPPPSLMPVSTTPLPITHDINQSSTSTTAGFEEMKELTSSPKPQPRVEDGSGSSSSDVAEIHVVVAVVVILLTLAIILLTVIAKIKSKFCFKGFHNDHDEDSEKCSRGTPQNDEKFANEETKSSKSNEETKSSKSN